MRKRGFPFQWVVVGLVVGVGAYYGAHLLRGHAPAAAAAGGGVPVSIAAVVNKEVNPWHEFSGILQAVNAVEVRPRIGGQITAVHFVDGVFVKKGQLLFTIDPRPYEAAWASAKGALAEAQSALARATKLVGSKAISRAEFEAAQSAYDRALGNAKMAQLNLEYTHIVAPISGKISRAEMTVGNVVDAGGAAPLLASIVDFSPIYASFDVDEQTFLSTIQGVPAAKLKAIPVEVALGNASGVYMKARIHAFDNQIAPGSGTIRVRALLSNAEATLVPGLYARVRLGAADAVAATLVHPTAIGTDQDKKFVMVVGADSKAEYRPVKLGGMVDGLQIVTEGLNSGEQIIVDGLQRARPGALIAGNVVEMTTLKPLDAPADVAAPVAAN